jgi:phage tail protein X
MTSETIEKITISGAGLTVSRLIWNRFQHPGPGMLGRIYDLNPGLADFGTEIPIGTTVFVPVPVETNSEPVVEKVTLWE